MSRETNYRRVFEYLQGNGGRKLPIARRNGASLYGVIAKNCDVDHRDVYDILLQLQSEGHILFSKPATETAIPTRGQLEILIPPLPKKAYQVILESALAKAGVDDCERHAARIKDRFKNFTEAELDSLFQGLQHIAEARSTSLSRYQASAAHLLASSKLLDHIDKPLRDHFEIDPGLFHASPKYLAVAGPTQPQAVILVENPNAFETAIQSGAHETIAWACTYGFGLGNEKAKQDGEMLESNLIQYKSQVVVLVRAGDPPRKIDNLLDHPNLYFWGDLDLSGLRIFDNLKKHYSQLQLSALYEPMINALRTGFCHPYANCVGKKGQAEAEAKKPPLTDTLARQLAALCMERAVDQEYVHDMFEEYSGRALGIIGDE